jgi:hypothetical protein
MVFKPADGRDALSDRYGAPYPILDPGDETSARWTAFSQAVLGFVPQAADPARWRAFLAHRYPNAAAVPGAQGATDFSQLEPPVTLPADGAALVDWYRFQSVVLPMERTAHRFTVLLPWPLEVADSAGRTLDSDELRGLAQRVVELQKPAHTVFSVRFFWAAFRVGEARLGDDTLLASGSRAPELLRAAVLGRADLGGSYLAGPVAGDTIRRPPEEAT